MRYLPKFRSINHLLVLLGAAWVVLFLYQERYRPYSAASTCKWPRIDPADYTDGHKVPADFDETRIMLIADPQLIDNHTYPGRSGPLLALSKHTADIYLKKNYRLLVKNLRPNHVIFLGDYLDNARLSSLKYYENEVRRFERIFKNYGFSSFHTEVPGNHDIGFGDGVKLPSRDRFMRNFGRPNRLFTVNHVDFVVLDTPSLLSLKQEINSEAREFMELIANEPRTRPRILLTHVPLFRDPGSHPCGRLRELKVWHMTAGYQYQSVLTQELSVEILTKIDPDLIFSGDDHDYCEIDHDPLDETLKNDPTAHRAHEITVKLILMAMGIKYPAVQLLTIGYDHRESLQKSDVRSHYLTGICYTATPYVDIFSYVVMAVFLGLMILWWNVSHRQVRHNSLYSGGSTSSSAYVSGANSFRLLTFLKSLETSNSRSMPLSLYEVPQRKQKLYRFLELTHEKLSRNGIIGFFGHSVTMAVVVITIYYVGFALTV